MTNSGDHAGMATRFALLLIVAGLPMIGYGNLVFHHFYVQGAYFWDSGSIAGMLWRHDLQLTMAPMFTAWAGESVYALHVIPLFSVLTAVSWHVPVSLGEWFALILGVGFALPALGVFWLLSAGFGPCTPTRMVIGAALSTVFAFNGIALAIARFPHPEVMLAGGLILVCAGLALRRGWVTATFLAFSLLNREDAGFHVFGLMAVLIAANIWRGRPWSEQRPYLTVAVIGLGYSLLAMLGQKVIFGASLAARGTPSQFVLTYLGDPPFSKISLGLVAARSVGLLLYRPYIVVPALIAVGWAVRARNPLIVGGYVAFLPWLALQVIADNPIAGTVSGYYAFPYIIASVWPLVAVMIDARQLGRAPDYRSSVIGFAAMLAASFLGIPSQWTNGGPLDLWQGFTTLPSLDRARATDSAVATLIQARAEPGSPILGDLTVDESVISLAPYSFPIEDAVDAPAPRYHVDTIAFFENGPDWVRVKPIIRRAGLDRLYRFEGTSILLATNRALVDLPGLNPDGAVLSD